MELTYILMMFLNTGFSSCPQNDAAQVQFRDKAAIKSEKIIYFDVHASGNERSYSFGKDLLLEYDINGNLLRQSIILADEDTEKETIHLSSRYHYQNDRQSKVENFSVLRDGIKKDEVTFTYRKNGKLEREEIKAFENGKEVLNKDCLYITYKYAKNETANSFRFDESARKFKLSYRTVKEFDSRGNPVKETDYDSENKPYRLTKRFYNDKNQLIKETRNDQYQDAEEIHVYNKEGDILKTTDRNGGETIYTYKYDDHHNWIEKTIKTTTVVNSKSEITTNCLIKRTLQYY